jgi:integrase
MAVTGRTRANGEGSIFPYRNGFAAYVWVNTPTGLRDRKWVYGKTRDVVHDKWLKLHQAAKAGPVATSTPTIAHYMHYWLTEVIEPNRAPSTYGGYEMFNRLYISPVLGTKRLDRLQVRDVQRWINDLARICQCCVQGKDAQRDEVIRRCCAVGRCCDDRLSARTVAHVRDCLRAALNHARDVDQLIIRNPVAAAKLPRRRKHRGLAWSSEEARRFLEVTRSVDEPLYAAFVLILVLGLRRGEVLGLKWDDVDLDGAELRIGHQLQRVRGQLYLRETKTETSEATLPLPDICLTALRLRKGSQEVAATLAEEVWHDFGFVFSTRFGTPIEPRNFNRSFHAWCERAGVRRIRVHDARRTCATLLADLDVHPRVVMQILRHAQIAVTMEIYTEVSSPATRAALKRLGDSLT